VLGGTAAGRSAGAHSTTNSPTAAAFAHALRRRQADAGEQRCRGQHEPTSSQVIHRNLLRLGFHTALSNDGTQVSPFRVSGNAWKNGVPTLFVPNDVSSEANKFAGDEVRAEAHSPIRGA
jgi:hypothetical protein